MKTAVRVGVGVLAIALLCSGSALAKKDKKGGGPQVPPVITAEQAKATVTAAIPKLTVGKPFSKQGKKGDIKFEVPLSLEGKIVAKVRLNPATGEILTKGQNPFIQKLSITPEQGTKAVEGIVHDLQVGPPWLGKQGDWKVPLLYKGAIIAEMSVHGQNGSILPDWRASKDATMFGN
uniref:PepSY domain-containing protein n=1 Tax=Desulfobacca acetoxidans TaxID=60893 RepID=A0A7C3UZM4_9BACT